MDMPPKHSKPPKTPRAPEKRKTHSSGSTPPAISDNKKTKSENTEKLANMANSNGTSTSGEQKLQELTSAVQFLTKSVDEIKTAVAETTKNIQAMSVIKEELSCVRAQNIALMEKLRLQEDYSRRDNMIITGLKEEEGENCRDLIARFLQSCFEMNNVQLVRVHRLGRPDNRDNKKDERKLIVRFQHHSDKEHVMKNKWKLKEKAKGVYVEDDYSNETSRRRSSLYPIVKELKKFDNKAHLRGDKIFTNGRLFSHRQLYDLPVDPHAVCSKSADDVTAFSGTYSKLSNLHLHPFELDGLEWHSVEHVYQYHKARDANNLQAAREIRMTTDPLDAMAIGKQVKATEEWKTKGQDVMFRAQKAKFSNGSLKAVLMNCKDTIGEASYDPFWGTGLPLHHKDALNNTVWVGENTTGNVLMRVREEMKN
jgi:ribA/ribD-fused uncharacterized protein